MIVYLEGLFIDGFRVVVIPGGILLAGDNAGRFPGFRNLARALLLSLARRKKSDVVSKRKRKDFQLKDFRRGNTNYFTNGSAAAVQRDKLHMQARDVHGK